MSNAKLVVRLLFLILLLAGAHILLTLNDKGEPLVSRTRLAAFSSAEVSGIVVERRGERPIVLAKKDAWRLESPFSALADEQAVMRVVDALTLDSIRSAHGEGELLKFGRTRSDYGMDDPSVRVTVSTAAGSSSVSFGKLTPVRDGVFAYIDGDPRMYVVGTNILAAVDSPAERFREAELFPSGVDGVDAFDVKRGQGSLLRFRLKDGVWTRSGVREGDPPEPASAVKVKDFLSALSLARAAGYVWPVGETNEPDIATTAMLGSRGLDADSSTAVTLHVGGSDRQVVFGKADEKGLVYALVQDGGAIVTVDGALADFARTGDFTDTRLFPFKAKDVTRVSLADGDVNYLLAREVGGAWRLDAPIAVAADQDSAAKLVEKLLSLRTEDRVADAAERGGPVVVVSLATNAPSETVSRDAILSSMDLADLRSRDIIGIDPADVKRLAVSSAGSERPDAVVFDRDLREWTVESSGRSGTVVPSAISDILAALSPLRAEKIVKLKMTSDDFVRYGLDKPRWTIAVDSFQKGALRRNIIIGERSHGGRFATLGASDAVFILSDSTLRRLASPMIAE